MELRTHPSLAMEPDSSSGAVRSRWLANLALTMPFLLLLWADLWHHVLWFDEINAWSIVAGSKSLRQMFFFVHFEGHPWLWYFVLYFPSRITHDPAAMKWVEGVIGTAVYLVLGLLSPFTRLQKLLIFASYYVVFEYTVMSRMYGLMLLFALLFVWRRLRKPSAVVGNVVLLGLLANTDLTGVLLAGALLLHYAFDLWSARRGWTRQQLRAAGAAVLVFVVMLAFSIYSLLPSKDISWEATGHLGSEALQPRRLVQSVGNLIASPWWPISRYFPHSFWITDSIANKKLLLLVPVVLFAYWRIFRGHRSLQVLMGLTLAFGMIFADVVYAGRVRHWGIAVVAFIAALWIKACAPTPDARRWSPWAYGLMSLGALAGLAATVGSWMHPFSQAGLAADWLRSTQPANVALVGGRDLNLASLTERLGRPAYFLECGCSDTMKLFSHERDSFPARELPARLTIAMQNLHSPELIMVNYQPLTPETLSRLQQASLQVTPMAQFVGSEDPFESFYFYRITYPGTTGRTP